MKSIGDYLERNFIPILGVSFILGLFLPGIDQAPKVSAAVTVATLIFVSCFKVDIAEIKSLRAGSLLYWLALRYLLVPFVCLNICLLLAPSLAPGVLLLSLMPSGASTPALTAIVKGNVAQSLALLVLTTAITPFLLPAVFSLLLGAEVAVSAVDLFISLCYILFGPLLLHLPLRSVKWVREPIRKNASALSSLLIGLLVILAVSFQRESFFQLNFETLIPVAVAILSFVFFGIAGLALKRGADPEGALSFFVCGLINNTALGITIALLHFDETTLLFMVLSEIPWLLSAAFVKRYGAKLIR